MVLIKDILILLLLSLPLLFVGVEGISPHLSLSAAHAETTVLPGGSMLENGRELLKAGQYQEALGLLSNAASAEPANPVVFNYLGEAYFRLKRDQEGINALNRAVSIDPGYILPHVGL